MESPFRAVSQSLYVSFSKSSFSVTEDTSEDRCVILCSCAILCIIQGKASVARMDGNP